MVCSKQTVAVTPEGEALYRLIVTNGTCQKP
jgi:hypothetical protein